VALWRIDSDWGFDGPAEAGSDVEGGRGFALVHETSGEQRQLSVEVAAGGPGVPGSRLREVARQYLNDPVPPRRVVLDREGKVGRVVTD